MKTKILLKEANIPTHWYNVMADMPNPPAPPLVQTAILWAQTPWPPSFRKS